MTTIQLESNLYIDTREFLGGISRLDISEIERFLSEVSMLLARRKAPSLPA